jgi:hypothetical protein
LDQPYAESCLTRTYFDFHTVSPKTLRQSLLYRLDRHLRFQEDAQFSLHLAYVQPGLHKVLTEAVRRIEELQAHSFGAAILERQGLQFIDAWCSAYFEEYTLFESTQSLGMTSPYQRSPLGHGSPPEIRDY